MDPIRHLRGSGARVDEVGGKAAGLDRLVSHGFPVPSATAITVGGYHAFIDHAGLDKTLVDIAGSEIPTPDRIESETERIDQIFLAAPLDPDLERRIRGAVRDLLDEGPIAVRSSATAEDLGSA